MEASRGCREVGGTLLELTEAAQGMGRGSLNLKKLQEAAGACRERHAPPGNTAAPRDSGGQLQAAEKKPLSKNCQGLAGQEVSRTRMPECQQAGERVDAEELGEVPADRPPRQDL